jgi:hypothetical protein
LAGILEVGQATLSLIDADGVDLGSSTTLAGGTLGSFSGFALDANDEITGHGRVLGNLALGTAGTVAGSGEGLTVYGDVSGAGLIHDTTIYGNIDVGNSAGQLTLSEVVIGSDNTVVALEVGGVDTTNFDQLMLAGNVIINGIAEIDFTDGFTPQDSDTFQLVELGTATLTGWFHQVTAPDGWGMSETGELYNLQYGTTPVLDGDFDGNGIVDAADYTVWQDNLGLDASILNGNGSGATTVVQADYLLWKTNFGQSAVTGSAANAVPEPSTLLLVLLALVPVARRR